MHAVVVKVSVTDGPVATEHPAVDNRSRSVAGARLRRRLLGEARGGDEGNSVVVFESEDAASAAAERIKRGHRFEPRCDAQPTSQVGEVVANA